MKKTLILTILAIIGLIAFVQSGILNSLIMFVLVGAIPGTSHNISPSFMLLAMMTIIWIVIFRLTAVETFYSITTKHLTKRQEERKKRMPRRRYNQI